MINRDTAELPEGLSSKFEVVGKSGRPGESTWLLVDTVTNQKYRLTPKTIEGWAADRGVLSNRCAAGPDPIELADLKDL